MSRQLAVARCEKSRLVHANIEQHHRRPNGLRGRLELRWVAKRVEQAEGEASGREVRRESLRAASGAEALDR